MPIYEFECPDCNIIIETLLPNNHKEDSITCPKCKKKMKRIISKTSFILKGESWAKDNYK